jgi:leader peptidase (prepilin peptidase) / N-methyltransferase
MLDVFNFVKSFSEALEQSPEALKGVYFAILGALCGSFANVVIYRYLSNESCVTPRSRCPSCGQLISWYDNIPILAWLLWLKRKCRFCKTIISFEYPLVEFISMLLFFGVFLKRGMSFSSFEEAFFLWGLLVLSVIDLKTYLLPDIFTLPAIGLGLLGAYLNPDRFFQEALLGVLFGGGAFWLLSRLYYFFRKEEGLGGGDIKLLAVIGAFLGWEALPFVLLTSSLIGSLAGLLAMKKSQKGFKTVIPFGPYLAFGSALYIFFGQYFARKYAEFLFPFLF